MTPHARRRSLRIPLYVVQLAGLLVSAALTVTVLWFGLSVLLSFGTYVETVLP